MKLKFYSFWLVALLMLACQSLRAYNAHVDGIFYNFSGTNAIVTYATTSYNSYSGSVAIPESITYYGKTYFVTSIGADAFRNCTGLTSVVVPNSVKEIAKGAFKGCSSLESISLPFVGDKLDRTESESTHYPLGYIFGSENYAGGITINQPVFYDPLLVKNQVSFTSYCIPSSLKTVIVTGCSYIAYGAFYGCSGLTCIEISNSVTSMKPNVFYGCTGLEDVKIPDCFNDANAFSYCRNLQCHNEYDNAYYLGNDENPYVLLMKAKSDEITSCEINENCKVLAASAFANCVRLTSFSIPSWVTSIGAGVFAGCTGLTTVDIPSGLRSIPSSVFSGCTGLQTVEIPNSVTSIGFGVFYGCTSLKSITMPYVLPTYKYDTSKSSTTETKYPFGYIFGTSNYEGAVAVAVFHHEYTGSALTPHTYYIPSSLKFVTITGGSKLPFNAFTECTMLTSVSVSNNMTIEGTSAFSGVKHISYSGSSTGSPWGALYVNGTEDGDFIYEDEEKTRLAVYLGDGGDVIIPDGVKSIGNRTFDGCTGLNSLTIPESVESIGTNAFRNCVGRLIVNCNIGNSAFVGARFDCVEIGETVTSVGNYAFSGCTGLQSIKIPNGVISIGNYAFSGCTGLTSVEIYNGVIGDYAFRNCVGLTSVEISNGVIGDYAFRNCTGLTSVKLSNGVTSIGAGSFFGCSALESMILPFVGDKQHVSTDANQYPFGYIFGTDSYDGSAATTQTYYGSNTSTTTSSTYYIPSSLKSVTITGGGCVPRGAFSKCIELSNITISGSVTSIGNSAFSDCAGLTSIIIGNSVTTIDDYAFQNCIGLETVTIPDCVWSVGNYAFSGCTGLKNVGIPNNVTSIGNYAFKGCTNLTSIEIPTSLAYIQKGTFYECGSLTSLFIPKNVNIIADDAFTLCSRVRELIIEDAERGIMLGSNYYNGKNDAFWGLFLHCSLRTLYLGRDLTYETNTKAAYYYGGPFADQFWLEKITIGDSVKSIGDYLFYESLMNTAEELNLTIGKNVTSVGKSAFSNCRGRLTIKGNVSDASTAEDGWFRGAKFSEVVIGDEATKIGKYAFSDFASMKKITIGKKVSRISGYAFNGCINLSEMYCRSTTPPACTSTAFDEDTYFDCMLYVPEESLARYQTANVWQNFYDMDVNPDYRPDHKLIYRIDGRIYQTVQVEEGATITPIEAPEREGYTFLGWSGLPDDMVMPDHDLSVIGSYAETITATALAITDGDTLTFPLAHTYEKLTYTRTFGNTSWQALYVPFSIPIDTLAEHGLQVAELNDTHQWDYDSDGIADSTRVEFFTITSGSTLANHPYLIRAQAVGTCNFTLEDVDVEATTESSIDCSTTRQLFTFTGTYTGVTGAEMYSNRYYAMAGGAFRYAADATVSLKPQRWYMGIENRDGSEVTAYAAAIRFCVDGIEELDSALDINGTMAIGHRAEDCYYGTNGVRRTLAPTQPGIYVHQGNKLLIR